MSTAIAPKGGTAQRLAVAARVVARVIGERRALDDALERETERLAPADRSVVQALAYGTLRWWPRLERLLAMLLDRPAGVSAPIRSLLGVALHQLEHSKHPAYAIVDEAVDAARVLRAPRATALINAILRRHLRESAALRARLEQDPVAQHAHPQWLLDHLRTDWPEEWREIVDANNRQAPMWLRVNRRKISAPAYLQRLSLVGMEGRIAPQAPEAIELGEPCDVAQLPGFAEGWISVQDSAAQLTAPFLDARAGMRVLDACAAPGGKACQLLEHADLELLALDTERARLEQVEDNLRRLELTATCAAGDARTPAAWWDGRPFDRILIDAPCSATGVIRRHPDIKILRRPGDVPALVGRQSELLRALWPLLAPGGRLLYATCSTLRAENQQVIGKFLEETAQAREIEVARTDLVLAATNAPGIQILPGAAGMDGFYYACLEQRRN